MNLSRRVKKLQAQGKTVEINKYYLLDIGGYNSTEFITKFFIGLAVCMIIGFLIFWPVSWIITDQRNSSNLDLKREDSKQKTQERIDFQVKKQKYVDSCKQAGSRPTDMSDNESFWKCA